MMTSICQAGTGLTVAGVKVNPHPHLDFDTVYDDNVNISPTNRQGDVSFVVRPGLELQIGDAGETQESALGSSFADGMLPFYSGSPATGEGNYLTLDYTAAIERYVRLDQYNSDNQQVQLNTHYAFNRLTLQLASTFQDLTDNNVTAGGQTHEQSNTTTLNADYLVSSKTSLELNYHQELNHYLSGGQIDSQQYELGSTFDYHLSSKTDVFGQYSHGWDNVSEGADAMYNQVEVGISGKLTSKIFGTAKVGYPRTSSSGLPRILRIKHKLSGHSHFLLQDELFGQTGNGGSCRSMAHR